MKRITAKQKVVGMLIGMSVYIVSALPSVSLPPANAVEALRCAGVVSGLVCASVFALWPEKKQK